MQSITYSTIPYEISALSEREPIDTDRLVDIIIASILLIPASIILGFLYILYFFSVTDAGPFLYRSVRLGKNKRLFVMYKVRTLKEGAEQIIGPKIYEGNEKLELWYGKFIRATRIDELPQLFNVLIGDMTLVGPRPVRPAQYEALFKDIKGYDICFSVRPGITGYSQFLTPHNTSKRIRSKIDAHFVKTSPSQNKRLLFFLWTLMGCFFFMLRELKDSIVEWFRMLFNANIAKNRRIIRRIHLPSVSGTCRSISTSQSSEETRFFLVDLNTEAMRIICDTPIAADGSTLMLNLDIIKKNRRYRLTCIGKVLKVRPSKLKRCSEYVLKYDIKSDFHRYLLYKYVLSGAIV